MKTLFTLLFILVVAGMIKAQGSGHLHYQLELSSDNPDMALALPMMEGSTMGFYFSADKTRVYMVMGSFMVMNTVVDLKKDKGLMLMEIMGNKTATELNLPADGSDSPSSKPETTVTRETKSILGFNSSKIIVKDDKGMESIIWITRELTAPLKGQNQFGNTDFDGVPMEFTTANNGMNIHFIATEFNKNPDPKIFNIDIPEGYTRMTEEDWKSSGFDDL